MNIFILDYNDYESARYYVDKHIVKIPLEATQVLSSVYYYTGESDLAPYKLSHYNHPWCKWARESLNNWLWLRHFDIILCKEYTYRYDRIHKCQIVTENMKIPNLPLIGLTKPPTCTPDDCKSEDIVKSYRDYYNKHKRHLFKWSFREKPYWIDERGNNGY